MHEALTVALFVAATLPGPVLVHDSRESSPAASVGAFAGTVPGVPPSPAPTVYERRAGRWRQFWLVFESNDQDRGVVRTGRHTGDWEMVQFRVDAAGRPVEAVYAQHSGAGAILRPGRPPPGRARSTAATRWANATAARCCCRSRHPRSPPWSSSDCAVGDHREMPNIFNPDWEAELPGLRGERVGAAAGGEKLGATLYEVDPGGRVSPLHIHHANEEMLFVVSGRPTLRTADGERELELGEVVGFPSGRRGVHQVLNRSDEPARVVIVSTMRYPEVVEHPDSNKVVAISGRPDETAAMFLAFRRDDAVAVTEGETD
jgi:uncharacterized cupin superfamily protein